MDQLKNYVFVTVGTTLFDDLVQAVDNLDFHKCLQQQGYKGIVVQIGVTQYHPIHATDINEINTYDFGKKVFHAFYFTQRPSISGFIENADLVISHAGSGSITETLAKHKALVVVVNTKLMNNHQAELANRLDKYVLVSEPSTLAHVIETDLKGYKRDRTLYKPVDSRDFTEFLSQQFEDTKTRGEGTRTNKRVKTMVVLGSGGHTAEMFVELGCVDAKLFSPRAYVLASTDSRSEDKIDPFEKKVSRNKDYTIHKIPRSRRVGQSYLSSIWTTLVAFLFCLKLVLDSKPDLIICNGPGTCVPIVMAAIMFRMVRLINTKVLFVESLARVEHLSLTGKILQYLVNRDWFVVQWPSLSSQVSKRTKIHVQNFYFPLHE